MKTKEKLVSPAYCRLSPCLPGKVVWKAKGLIGGKQKMSICADPFFGFRSIFFGVLGVLAIAMGTSDGQIIAQAPVITSEASASAKVGAAFSYQIVASNSAKNYRATGLPRGLAVHAKTGSITGVPTAIDGSYNVTLTATNAGGTGNKVIELTVAPTLPLIAGPVSATGSVGRAFNYKIAASNFARTYGATGLPSGLSVNATSGIISGVPADAGNTTVVLSASNGAGTATKTIVITIMPLPPVISNSGSASGNVGVPFSYQIVASHSPTSYSATGLPRGLTINKSNGIISGTPLSKGYSYINLIATNAGGSAKKSLALTVTPTLPLITSAESATGTVGSAFIYKIVATGFARTYGATGLPSGLSVNATSGDISGVPAVAGNTTVVLSASNDTGTATKTIVLTIMPLSPVISNSESASGNVGVPFSYQIVASHSPTSYSATGLPRGLMINESNGMISGVPVAIGNSTVVLTAMNSGGSATKSIALKIVLIRLAISDCTLPSGDRALPYAGHTFTASGGVGGNSWSVIDGILPLGMTLNASTGKLAGTPTIAGSFTFVLRVEDASHSTDEVEVVLDILPTTFHRPPFSWNKVPIYKMFGDGKRLLSDAELNILAGSLDFLCIEKSHGLKELGCAKLGAAREIARFKKIDPKICGLFYFNSAYAYPFTTESKVFGNKVIAEPFRSFLLLDPQTGQPKRLGTVPMFDVLKPEFRTWWAETIGKGVRETGADGVFVDQMHGNVFSRRKQQKEVDAAQAEMMRMAKKAIGPEKILLLSPIDESPALFEIGDAFMFEHYNADQLSKEAIVRDWDVMKKISSAGKISVWRIGVNKEPEGAKFVSGAELEKFARKRLSYYLAAFLIGAQPYSYFQYNWGWTLQDGCLVDYPEFSKPLGAPKAEATRPDPSAWIFTREFEKASVRVDLATGQGEIHWH